MAAQRTLRSMSRRSQMRSRPTTARRLLSIVLTVLVGAVGLVVASAAPAGAAPGAPLPCDGELYLSRRHEPPPGPNMTELTRLDFGQTPPAFVSLGVADTNYNAMGFNPDDGYLYALANNGSAGRLLQIDAAGATTNLGAITGFPPATSQWVMGAFLPDGKFLVGQGGVASPGSPLSFLTIDIPTRTVVPGSIHTRTEGGFSDFAVNPVDARLYSYDEVTDKLLRMDPVTGAVDQFGPSGIDLVTVGAAWFDPFGRFYGYGQEPGGAGQTTFFTTTPNIVNPAATPPATVVGRYAPVGGADGASCAFGIGFDKTVSASTTGVPGAPGQTATAHAGAVVTYQYDLISQIAMDQDGIDLSDPLGDGRTVVPGSIQLNGVTGTPDYSDPTHVRIDSVFLTPNTPATISVDVQIPPDTAPGTLLNQAFITGAPGALPQSIASDDPFVDGADNPTPLVVSVSADPYVAKDGPATVDRGEQTTYTITAGNNGPSTATGVTVEDSLPAGLTYVSADPVPTSVSVDQKTLSWSVGSLPPDGTPRTFDVTVTASADGDVVNTASISSTSDSNTTNNTANKTTTVTPVADVHVTKTGPASVDAGQDVTYTLVVENDGPSTAEDVVLRDPVPAGYTYVSSTAPGALVAGEVVWNLGSVAPGVGNAVSVDVTFRAPDEPTQVSNVANVTSSTGDPDPGDNSSTVRTGIDPLVDVTTEKTGDATVPAGTDATFTITVTNDGPSTAHGIVVTDTLPAGYTFVSASDGGAETAPGSGVVQWDVGTLASQTSVERTVVATAPDEPTFATNEACSRTSTPQSVTSNDCDLFDQEVERVVDVSVVKSGPAVARAADEVTWTLDVANAGPSTALAVEVTDTLPPGFTYVTADPAPSSVVDGVIVWHLGDIGIGTLPISVTARAPDQPVEDARNLVELTPDPSDSDPDNDDSHADITITPVSDLSVDKHGPARVDADTDFDYTITVTNAGPSDAPDVVVIDDLPEGFEYVADDQGGVVQPDGTVRWEFPVLAAGDSIVIVLTVHAPDQPVDGAVNAVTVEAAPEDPDGGNDGDHHPVTVDPVIDHSITKTAAETVDAAETHAYTIEVANAGPSDATDTVVTDRLPDALSFVAADNGGLYDSETHTVTWDLGTMAAGESKTLTVTTTAPSEGGIVENRASIGTSCTEPMVPEPVASLDTASAAVSAASHLANDVLAHGCPRELTPDDNEATSTVVVEAVTDLTIDKTSAASGVIGETVVYTITVVNGGPSTATDVEVTDELPSGLAYRSDDAGGSVADGVVTWNFASLAPGDEVVIHLTAELLATGEPGTVVNIAAVSSAERDLVTSDNTDSASLEAVAAPAATPIALPRTGGELFPLTRGGVGAILLGLVLVAGSRRYPWSFAFSPRARGRRT